ncbi:MAG: hypothetical protein ACREL9_05740 [Gemmatimonadales bacterium]
MRLRIRADSVAIAWRRANALADALDSLALLRSPVARDTIRAGALWIIADASPLPLREAAARAWQVLDSLYGDEAQSLVRRPIVILPFDPDTTPDGPVARGVLALPWDTELAALTGLLAARAPLAPPDAGLTRWLGEGGAGGTGSVRPLLQPRALRSRVYVELVTTPSGAARDCYLGDLGRCRTALELTASPDIALLWYVTPAERREAVTRSLGGLARGPTERAFRACARGNDTACVELLRSTPREFVPRPLTPGVRQTVVDLALRLGGRDAYRRLIGDPTLSIAERLAAAARVPVDSLLTTWRAEILAAYPRRIDLPSWGWPVALGWVIVFAGCALWSSRWRVS